MPRFILNEKQQACLKTLLEALCQETNASALLDLACHFREKTEWGTVEAETDEDMTAEPYGVFLTLHLGQIAEGYMRMGVWRRSHHEFTVTLSSNENLDFSLHRYCEGELWKALDCLFADLEIKAV